MNTPGKILHAIGTFAVLLGLWLLWSGHYTAQITTFGVLSCLGVLALGLRMGVVDREGYPFQLVLRLPLYLAWLIWEVIKSNLHVARVVLSPRMPLAARLVRTEATQRTDLGQVIYANSITLTPGTVSLDVREGHILVHALTDAAAEGLLTGEMDRKATWVEGEG